MQADSDFGDFRQSYSLAAPIDLDLDSVSVDPHRLTCSKSVTLSNQSLPAYTLTRENSQTGLEKEQALQSMQEYYQLQRMLFITTLVLTGIVFIPVWFFYSWQIALNYLLGAGVGVFYLKLLAREVETLGTAKQRLGIKGLVLFAGLIILACTREELQIIPVFLGFMTYKAAIIVHTIQVTVRSLLQGD